MSCWLLLLLGIDVTVATCQAYGRYRRCSMVVFTSSYSVRWTRTRIPRRLNGCTSRRATDCEQSSCAASRASGPSAADARNALPRSRTASPPDPMAREPIHTVRGLCSRIRWSMLRST
eukprot:2877889-Prymnesium_polylepis.1